MATNQPPNTLIRTCFNKFSVHSMTHEVKRVLEGIAYPDEGLIELAKDKWFDPHSYRLKLASYDEAMDNRRAIHCGMLEIKNSKVVIMTLGLTETWLDTRTGLAMNEHPGVSWLARMPDRWRFIDYGYADILDEMVRMLQLIRECIRADMKFIVTVSPIPLLATCKTQDVVVATSGSKCVLRAVAEELYRRFDFVDYFPSYEYVMYSPRNVTWLEDQIHTQPRSHHTRDHTIILAFLLLQTDRTCRSQFLMTKTFAVQGCTLSSRPALHVSANENDSRKERFRIYYKMMSRLPDILVVVSVCDAERLGESGSYSTYSERVISLDFQSRFLNRALLLWWFNLYLTSVYPARKLACTIKRRRSCSFGTERITAGSRTARITSSQSLASSSRSQVTRLIGNRTDGLGRKPGSAWTKSSSRRTDIASSLAY